MSHENLQIGRMDRIAIAVLCIVLILDRERDNSAVRLLHIIREDSETEGSGMMQDEAFTLLYQKYANFIYSIALSYLKNPAEAEDVTADVFVKLLESDVSFPEDIAARAWLATVTRNQCKNLLRHWLRNKRDAEEVMEQIPVTDQSAELRAVMDSILKLPEKYRLPLLLFAVEGYSVRETAEILHLNESTVRTRIARARDMIRKETGVENA